MFGQHGDALKLSLYQFELVWTSWNVSRLEGNSFSGGIDEIAVVAAQDIL